MSRHTDIAAIREQIGAILGKLSVLEGEGDELPSNEAKAFAGEAAADSATPLALTDQQRRICVGVINVFETGKVEGDYGAVSIFHDGPNRIRQVTYGRAQTTEYSNLRELVSDYVAANGLFSAELEPFVAKIGTKVGVPPHSPLVDNQTFLTLLRKAGADPVMRRTQDVFFDRVYLQPALTWAGRNGFAKALSGLVIYDSFTHSGGILSFLRARFPELTPTNGGDEETWIAQYVAVRQDWLANNANPDLRATIYRTKDLTREINRHNWDLAQLPILANGVKVDGAPDKQVPAATGFSRSIQAAPDDDPAAPAEGEISETAGREAARLLANLGAPSVSTPAADALQLTADAIVRFDLSPAKAFLNACMTSVPRVSYGLGKKFPRLDAVPGRDFTQVDCSGFVREAVRLSTSSTLPFPDGSVVQHDWIRERGFGKSTVRDGGNADGVVRIAFLRPQDSPEGIGHVVLISGGMTLESHGHVGPDARKWDGSGWQAKSFVYVLAQDGRLATRKASMSAGRIQSSTAKKAKADTPSSDTVIQGWEDDPEPGVLVQRAQPDLARQPLAFAFDQPAPAADVYQPGTPEFRYWTAAEALRRGADYWAPLMANAEWQPGATLNVILDEGEDLNAYYDRNALNFFHGQGGAGTIYSGESPDVVCHEMGHAILDSIKPQLFDAMSAEVAAFHEAFADVSAIVSALQLPSLRTAILTDSRGKLYISSRLSRLAEQLGSAIRLTRPDQAEPDCLRNAMNSWVYQDPTALPQMGPVTQLTAEPHNFSRVFSGAVYEIMAGMLAAKAANSGSPTDEDLQAASVEIGQILIAGVQQAPVVPNWYAQVAAGMVGVSSQFNPDYPAILRAVFVRRSILSMDTAVNVEKLHQSLAAVSAARDVNEPLAEIALAGEDYGFDEPIVVMAASHARPFLAKSAATLHNGSIDPVSSSTAAKSYLDDLFTQGRVDYGGVEARVAHFHHGHRLCSHALVRDKGAVRLRRRLFDCGFGA